MSKANVVLAGVLLLAVVAGAAASWRWFETRWGEKMETMGEEQMEAGEVDARHPLQIEELRKGKYEGSEIVIEKELKDGSGYHRYYASYMSDGLKIYGLLTVPAGAVPQGGFPAIVFNHGYIPPQAYRTEERYLAYVDYLARRGYVVFKIDYRGHDKSEGEATGAYGSSGYLVDALNAVGSLKRRVDVDGGAVGMWGHSMGGHVALKAMVVSKEVRAGVIWGGVVGSYQDMLSNWTRRGSTPPPVPTGARRWRQTLVETYGSPEANPEFWNSISANSYLKDLSGPVQLHHGESDPSVPAEFSKKLYEEVRASGGEAELYLYPGDDHNISDNFGEAIIRTVEFFDKYLKTGEKKVSTEVKGGTVAEGLDTPWSLAFLPGGEMLVTERPGRVKKIGGNGEVSVVAELKNVVEIGEGGLLGMALHPDFAKNGWIYFYYTYQGDDRGTKNRVVRMKYEGGVLSGEEVLVDEIPGASNHNGGRMIFGPDGFLYITTGDAQNPSQAQDSNSMAGKILRVDERGAAASDNTFGNRIYSLGHRNPQGLAFDGQGQLWETEHGRSGLLSGLDEVNRIERGRNYGWPEIQGGEKREGMETPAVSSGGDTWAPGGLAFWDDRLYWGGLRGESVYEMKVGGGEVKRLYQGEFGRVREVAVGPDGWLYITTSNQDGRGKPKAGDDKVVRLMKLK